MTKVVLESSHSHGKGVFACAAIDQGECIMTFAGALVSHDQVDFDDYHLQVGEDLYLGPSRGLDDYVNHSCDPNSGFKNGLDLVALRDILPGEEITWDYSTAIDESDFAGFPCSCGVSVCRGKVESFRHLPAVVQERLRPWLLPYIQHKYFSSSG